MQGRPYRASCGTPTRDLTHPLVHHRNAENMVIVQCLHGGIHTASGGHRDQGVVGQLARQRRGGKELFGHGCDGWEVRLRKGLGAGRVHGAMPICMCTDGGRRAARSVRGATQARCLPGEPSSRQPAISTPAASRGRCYRQRNVHVIRPVALSAPTKLAAGCCGSAGGGRSGGSRALAQRFF